MTNQSSISGWQDIASAPRDGTEILLWLGDTIPDFTYVQAGSFLAAHEHMGLLEAQEDCWMLWHEHGDDWWFVPVNEPRGWFPMPKRNRPSSERGSA